MYPFLWKEGKYEGFESCDRPIVRKRPIWVKIGDVLSRVTLKFDGWPWKTIGHLSVAVSSFVQHFIAIGEFKLEFLSGNAQFGSNSTIFRAVWPWNLTYSISQEICTRFRFAVLCCGYTLTDFPISTRLTLLALWQSNDCPSASKATLMNMDKYFMWIHYERLHNHNKAKHNKTVCISIGIYCMTLKNNRAPLLC